MKLGSRSVDRYLLVGLVNTGLDLALFTLLAVGVGLHAVLSNAVSTVCVMTFSFFVNRAFVFRSSVTGLDAFARFTAVTLFSGWVVQSTVIVVVLALADWWAPALSGDLVTPAAKIVAMGAGMVFNFVGYRWLFARGPLAGRPRPGADEPADDRPGPSAG